MDFLYDVAVAAIIKDEGPYLAEWLDYHERAGIDHFYLYDNGSTDNTQAVLAPYVERGFVTRIDYPGVCRQFPAYNDAIRHYRYLCRYIAFIDADEFLFPPSGKTIRQEVLELLRPHPQWGGLTVNWRFFGTSGYQTADEYEGLLNSFCHRAEDGYEGNATVKSIVNPRAVELWRHPHFPEYYAMYRAHDEAGHEVTGYENKANPAHHLRLNHYATKSKQEWLIRRSRPTADDHRSLNTREYFDQLDQNDIYDDSIVHYRDSLPLARADYRARLDAYRAELVDDITALLEGRREGSIDGLLGDMDRCRELLADFLGTNELQAIERGLAECLIDRLDRMSHPIAMSEVYSMFKSLPDFSMLGMDIQSGIWQRCALIARESEKMLCGCDPNSNLPFDYGYLAELLDVQRNYVQRG